MRTLPYSANAGPYLAIGLFGKAKAEGDILDEYEFDDNSTNVFGDDAMKRFDFGLGIKSRSRIQSEISDFHRL